MRRLLEEQDTVFGCYYAAKWGKFGWAGGERRQNRDTQHTRGRSERIRTEGVRVMGRGEQGGAGG